MITRLQNFFLYTLLCSIPLQAGKHFWPSFSKISGIRVDYLSPTLYLTDILIVCFVVLTGVIYAKSFLRTLQDDKHKSMKLGLVLFLLSLLLSTLFARSTGAAIYGSIKYIEFLVLGISIAYTVKKSDSRRIIWCFVVGSLFASVLAIVQFGMQSSVGSVLYYLGERSFTVSTPGIAVFVQNGIQYLRPYATFAHPNLLAFYLFSTLVLLLFYFRGTDLKLLQRSIFILIAGIDLVALVLTFSRSILLFFSIFLIYYALSFKNKQISKLLLFAVGIVVGSIIFAGRLNIDSVLVDLAYRFDLLRIGFDIALSHLFTGIGPKNFFVFALSYFHTFSPIFLQPIHNVFILLFVETGMLGIVPLCILLWKSRQRLYLKQKADSKNYLFYSWRWIVGGMLFVSLGDHFFITLQQGLLFSSVLFGIMWSGAME